MSGLAALARALALVALAAGAAAQTPDPPALDYGAFGVGFRLIEARDSSRAFRPKRDWRGRRAQETARPVQVGVWYPAAPAPDARPVPGAAPRPGSHPTVVYFTSAGVNNPLLPAYLASHGFVVATFPSNGRMTRVALEYTPNPLTLETDIQDGGFVHALLRRLPMADGDRLAVAAFSGGSLAALLWAMRDMQADAVVTIEGWERYRRGADLIRASVHYDPARIRVPFLALERAADEASPAFAKVPDVLDSLRYADLLRVAFRDASHGDFLSRLATGHTPDQPRIYATAARLIRLFLQARLEGDDAAADSLAALRPPPGDAFFRRSVRSALPAAPTEEELFRLAETDPDEAARVYNAARAREPGVRLFRERVLVRAARFAATAADRVTLLELVVDAYPESVDARRRLAEARAAAEREAGG